MNDKAINIDKAIKVAKNRIHLVGVELEGGWIALPPNTNIVHDGSVVFSGTELQVTKITIAGELPSAPMEPNVMPKWMKKFYPHAVNATCGMHVHVSFRSPLTYQRLITQAFPDTIVAYMKRWADTNKLDPKKHPIWPRLEGKSEYCQHAFHPDAQVTFNRKDFDHHRPGHRYTHVAYHWTRYGTIEFRLLPMMENADLAIKAIQELLDITNGFLLATKSREEKIKGEFNFGNDEMKDEKVIRL